MEATLKLFKALPITNKGKACDETLMRKTIPLGFVFSPEVIYDCSDPSGLNSSDYEGLISLITSLYGLSAEKLNASFHKSWQKIKDTPIEQLVVEQLAHYCTTYGKGVEHEYLDEKGEQWGVDDLAHKVANLSDIEMDKIWDKDYIYIPKEVLKIPEITNDIKLIIIKGYTKEELKVKLLKLLGSGIALAEDTIKDCVEVAGYVEIGEKDLAKIKNKEVRVIMYDKLKMLPANPTEFLRFVIYKTTDKTLIIKNPALIAEIKEKDRFEISELFVKYSNKYGLEKLAEVFYRFKPIFLAFRGGIVERKMINRIRRLAVKYHKPMPEDFLNTVTSKNYTTLNIDTLIDELNRVNTFRKIRLAYALKFRTKDVDSILYRIRNGKSYAKEFNFNDKPYAESVLNIILESIIQDISKNVKGKKIYIPSYITYTLPATEKQFTGFFPSGTYVSMPKDMIFGVHWENVGGHRIDLDLSTISVGGKYGWDSYYRNDDRTILFSGDLTDACKPKGATELFYVKKQVESALILMVNYYNFDEDIEVPFKIMVAKEQPYDVTGIKFIKNYMVNPNNVLAVTSSKMNQKQKILGLAVTTLDECRFYFAESYIGNTISSRNTDFVERSRRYLFDFYENAITLEDILNKAGAMIICDTVSDCDIDLSPESLEKDTILNLLIDH